MDFRCQYKDSNGERCSAPAYQNQPHCRWHCAANRVISYSNTWPFKWSPSIVGLVFLSLGVGILSQGLLNLWMVITAAIFPFSTFFGILKDTSQFSTHTRVLGIIYASNLTALGTILIAQGRLLQSSFNIIWPKIYLYALIILLVNWLTNLFIFITLSDADRISLRVPSVNFSSIWSYLVISAVVITLILDMLLVIDRSFFPHLLAIFFLTPILWGLPLLCSLPMYILFVALYIDTQYGWIAAARKRLDV